MVDKMVKSLKVGISGVIGIGKTDTLKRIISMLSEEGVNVGGMITEPILEDNRQMGFQVMNWKTKEKAVFAHLNLDSQIRIKGYGVDIHALNQVGVRAIEEAIQNDDLILVDEIGKMEVESEEFNRIVKIALDVNKPMILTFNKKSRNPLLQDVRRRDDVRMLELTDVNRDLLPYKVVDLFKEEM
ncbi:MAG: NTPase [Candidatus Saliniplasma sp.]